MQASRDRIDQLADATRQTAQEVEGLRAALTALQAQVSTVQAQLEQALSAQTDSASAIERLRARLAQLESIAGRMDHLRDETAERLEAHEASLRQEAMRLHQRIEEAERLAHQLTPLVSLGQQLEELPQRLRAGDRQRQDITSQLNQLAARVEELATQRTTIQEAVRQAEVRLTGRLDQLAQGLAGLSQEVERWRERLDGQTETVSQARAIAEQVLAEAERLRREQHELSEVQRLWEERIQGLLGAERAEADKSWQTFLNQRRHEWDQLAAENAARDDRLAEQAAAMEELHAELVELARRVGEQFDAQQEQLHQVLRQLCAVAEGWGEAAAGLARAAESGLPPDQRPSVAEERRRARRRAMRARRDRREE